MPLIRSRPGILIGALGTLLASCEILIEPDAHVFGLSLGPAIVMCVGLMAGAHVSFACAAIVSVAAFLNGGTPYGVTLTGITGAICGELLRRGRSPVLLVCLLFLASAADQLAQPAETWRLLKTLAWCACHAGANVAVATVVLVLIPRRSTQFAPHCRVRWAHIVFALVAGTWSTAGLFLLKWKAVEVASQSPTIATTLQLFWIALAAVFTTLLVTTRLKLITERVRRQQRDGHSSQSERRRSFISCELPIETLHRVLERNREVQRLMRNAERRAREAAEARETIARMEEELRETRQTVELRTKQVRKLMRAHEKSSARLQALMQGSLDITLFTDEQGIIRAASRSVTRVLGFQAAQLEGRPLKVLIPPGMEAGHPLDLSGYAPGNHASRVAIVSVRTADGKATPVRAHVHAFAFRNSVAYAVQLHGSTDMRDALAAKERTGTLTQSTHQSRDHFIATMSHELRTPLHGLIATLDMMRPGPECPPEFEQRLSIARLSARSLLKIANDILDLTRFDSGHFQLEKQPFSLGVILQEIMDESRARADSLGLRLEKRIVGELPPAFIGDAARIKQILNNLMTNALKFTRRGGITLRVAYERSLCIVDVIDTGEGIPEDQRESIFEPFVQVVSAANPHVGGTGLGLPICRRLAHAMGGTLTLLRSDHTGSTFRLAVPLQPSFEGPTIEQSLRVFHNPRGRILVVEDNPANRYVAEALLTSLECPTTIVESGHEALELLETREFDLILMDCQMPGLDGYETTRRARRVLKTHVPIIAMTANAMAEDKARCLAAGMDDFLPKPFGRPALHDILCKWLKPAEHPEHHDLERRVAHLPTLELKVFEELCKSLQWRREPLLNICTNFTASAEKVVEQLERKPGADRRLLRRGLHTVLGSAGMVGARQVEFIAHKLQEDVKAYRNIDFDTTLQLLKNGIRNFEREFHRRLDDVLNGDRHVSAQRRMSL